MSNKSRLQTNNTNLQSLIDKANALPDAGGSGGTLETCYCMIAADAPTMDAATVTYTNANMQLATKNFEIMSGTRIEVVKGTIITIAPWSGMSGCSGDCTEIFKGVIGGAYFINGDSNVRYG
jgi:hypothetical protein